MLTGCYKVKVTQLCIFVLDAKVEKLVLLRAQGLPRSIAKQSQKKQITKNKETAKGDRR